MKTIYQQSVAGVVLLSVFTLIACSGTTDSVTSPSPKPRNQSKPAQQNLQETTNAERPSTEASAVSALSQRLLRISKVIEDDRGRPFSLEIPEIRAPYAEGAFGRGATNLVRIVGPGPKIGGRSSIVGMVDLAGAASQTVLILGISVDHSINGLEISLANELLWVHDQTSYTTAIGSQQVATIIEVLDRKEMVAEALRGLQAAHEAELEKRKAERIEAQRQAQEEMQTPAGREKAAAAKLKLAMIMYRQDREKGRTRLEAIVEEFPETQAASEATAFLTGKKPR